ncbi:hypothetical protein N0V93_002994 [Gnomoniopsis smithogilvyi]|uniref:Cytochrome P450 n=1 Tax=Gnomoniopsis smithogilvyi TaxID=1191159 RepID=A0A9W9CZP8_9PEZI|nr:hypothetical protein N0V93_002994 [Gnomoniopsis smithogilvyi]
MALDGGRSIRQLGLEHSHLPILTLVVPFSRLYVVTSPSVAAAIQRRPTAELSFNALLPDIVQRVMGLDHATRAIVERGLDPEPGEHRGFLSDLHDMLVSRLGPGPDMDTLTLQAVGELGKGLDAYATLLLGNHGQIEDLLGWVRHLVTHSTARLLYGSGNPFTLHPSLDLEGAFWDFDHGLGSLLVGIWPSVTARKAYAGREALVAAFRKYIEEMHYMSEDDGPPGEMTGADTIVLERIRIARAHGFSTDGIARSEVSFLFAGIVNTATTTFWTLANIFADHELLRVIREELAAVATESLDGNEHNNRRLSLKQLVTGSPTLYAVYKEVLRLGSNNFSTRLVRKNTTLTAAGVEGEIWLRKGGVVQIAGGVMHGNPAIWGDDVGVFNPKRHLQKNIKGEEDKLMRVNPAAYRAFGGGRTICPGRHFATGEILGLVASIVMRFEMVGPEEAGEIKIPEIDDRILPVHILEPVAGSPVRVRISLREGQDGARVEVVR